MMHRRHFLRNAGLSFGTAMIAPAALTKLSRLSGSNHNPSLDAWDQVRGEFLLDHSHIQMAQMLLASHPARVRDAIAKHRKAFNENPATYWEEMAFTIDQKVSEAAAMYMHCDPEEIGLTGSTTEGLAILLNGFKLKPGDEVLSTNHDHYSTDKSIDYACAKRGATNRRIDLYANPATASADEIVSKIRVAIKPETRLVVVTWVHSCTGVKLPVREIAKAIHDSNAKRNAAGRVYFLVDGVHGFGNQAQRVGDLGCDFFAAGTHKWLYGPRGTGIVYGRRDAWDMVEPTIPPFTMNPFLEWLDQPMESELTFRDLFSPGGFHAFEHRWALHEAFEFHQEIGPEKVHKRTTALNTMLKEGMGTMQHVTLHTPVVPELSAGINCFEVNGYSAKQTLEHLHKHGIIASTSPYAKSYARLTPCIINTVGEVNQCLEVLGGMA